MFFPSSLIEALASIKVPSVIILSPLTKPCFAHRATILSKKILVIGI
jgi:hypothetical protein